MVSGQGSHWLIESPTVVHLCVNHPPEIFVNLVFKHIHAASIYITYTHNDLAYFSNTVKVGRLTVTVDVSSYSKVINSTTSVHCTIQGPVVAYVVLMYVMHRSSRYTFSYCSGV